MSPAPVTYTARCQRVGNWWEITVPELDEVTLVALMTGVDPATVKVKVEADTGPGVNRSKTVLAALAVIGAAAATARTLIHIFTRSPVD